MFSVFPNLVMLVSLANCFMYRARPNGDDPDSCIFDMWALRLFPPSVDPPTLVRETARVRRRRRVGCDSRPGLREHAARCRPGCTRGVVDGLRLEHAARR